MKLEAKTRELLRIAADYRAEHSQALLAQAALQRRRILKAAHLAARQQLRSALAPERDRLAAVVAESEAKLVTCRRLREQRRLAEVLKQAWPRMVQALVERWGTPAGRSTWVRQHLAVALQVMPGGAWKIQHPQHWPAEERERALQWLKARGIEGVELAADLQMQAGIRVASGPNLLDASLEGLLADRSQIEGHLLHYLVAEP